MNTLSGILRTTTLVILLISTTTHATSGKDTLDKQIENLSELSEMPIIKRTRIYDGDKLKQIRWQFGKSVQEYRQILFHDGQINVVSFTNDASASAFLVKASKRSAGTCIFRQSNNFIEVIGKSQTQLRVLHALNPDSLVGYLLGLGKRGVEIISIYYLSLQEIKSFEEKFETGICAMLNTRSLIDNQVLDINYILTPTTKDIENLKRQIISAGQYPENIFSFENILIEICSNKLSKDERKKLHYVVEPDYLTKYLLRLEQKGVKIIEAYYLSPKKVKALADEFKTPVEAILNTRCWVSGKALDINYILLPQVENINSVKKVLIIAENNTVLSYESVIVDIHSASFNKNEATLFTNMDLNYSSLEQD